MGSTNGIKPSLKSKCYISVCDTFSSSSKLTFITKIDLVYIDACRSILLLVAGTALAVIVIGRAIRIGVVVAAIPVVEESASQRMLT